jgi:hypothetical protein
VESSITEEETKFALHLAGPAHVDLQTAWIVDMELKGDVRASGFKTVGTRKTDVSGTGDIALTRRTTIL